MCSSPKYNSFRLLLPASVRAWPTACAKMQPILPLCLLLSLTLSQAQGASTPTAPCLALGSLMFAGVSRTTRAQGMPNVPLSPSVSRAGRRSAVASSSKGGFCTEPAELQD